MTTAIELWRPQVNQIYAMDALAYLRQIPDNSVHCVVTSPPYDHLRSYGGFAWNFEGIAQELYRVMRPGGVGVWIVSDQTINGSKSLTSFRQALYFQSIGFRVHDVMVWDKIALPGLYGKRYEATAEWMFIITKGEPVTFHPVMQRSQTAGRIRHHEYQNRDRGGTVSSRRRITPDYKRESVIWRIPSCTESIEHPARFPAQLVERHIQTWTNPSDIVLDPFMGAGTTALVARRLGRDYMGCDLSPEYVALAQGRLRDSDPYQRKTVAEGIEQLSLFEAVS